MRRLKPLPLAFADYFLSLSNKSTPEMKISQAHIEQLRNLLARPAQRFVIVSHTNPDGDAVGSSLAWAEILRGMGHAVTCIVPNKYPYFLDWMEGIDEIVIFKTNTEGRAVRAIEEADAIF